MSAKRTRIEGQAIAAVAEVAVGPFADARQAGAERLLGHVLAVADEDGGIAQVRIARHMLDVVGIAVGAQRSLALVAWLHRKAADEVGEENIGLALELRVLVIVVVHVPGLVADHDVVVLGLDQVDEGHEVVIHDLVHRAQGEEGRQIVFSGHLLEVAALVGQALGDRVQAFAFALEVASRPGRR